MYCDRTGPRVCKTGIQIDSKKKKIGFLISYQWLAANQPADFRALRGRSICRQFDGLLPRVRLVATSELLEGDRINCVPQALIFQCVHRYRSRLKTRVVNRDESLECGFGAVHLSSSSFTRSNDPLENRQLL